MLNTFCAIEDGIPGKVLGFYSLAPALLKYARMPEALVKGVARRDIDGFRLARLAVARDMQGRGIGGQLLLAAGKRLLVSRAAGWWRAPRFGDSCWAMFPVRLPF